jgi:hypothetical protein
MSMNSFSLRAERQHYQSFEQEAPELLQLCVEGDPSPRESKRRGKGRKSKSLDLSAFQDHWDESNGQHLVPHNDLQLTVLIADHFRAFRTRCEDVTTAGLLLRDLIPEEFLDKDFDLVLIRKEGPEKKSFFFFRARAAGKCLQSRRIQFGSMTSEMERKLRQLYQKLCISA